MRKALISAILLVLLVGEVGAQSLPWQLSFSPGAYNWNTPFNQTAVLHILSAQTSVELTAYNLTDQAPSGSSIASALIDRHQALGAGSVRVITDKGNLGSSAMNQIIAAGIPVVDDGNDPDEMHDKFIVVDGARVWTSTANFTEPGFSSQDNMAIWIDDASVAQAYLDEFNEMWGGTFKEASPPTPFTEFVLGGDPLRVLFGADDNPISDTTRGLRSFVRNATESVHFAIYTYTGHVGGSGDLADDMVTAFQRGVLVRGVLDRGMNNGREPYTRTGSVNQMDELGMDVRLDANSSLMHNKMAVIDQRILAVGSSNFTWSADNRNDENMVFFENQAAARRAIAYVHELYDLTSDSGTPASPSPDRVPPPSVLAVTLTDAPGTSRVSVGWAPSTAPDRSRYHVFLWDAPIGAAELDFRTGLDPVVTVPSAGQWPIVLTRLSDGRPISDGVDLWAAVTVTDHAGNESVLAGGSASGPVRSVPDNDLLAPTFAGIQTLVSGGQTQIQAGWSAATDNLDPSTAIRYRVYVATAPGGQNFLFPDLETSAFQALVAGLMPATPYWAVVRAVDSSGNEDGNTVEMSVTTCATVEICDGLDNDCDGLIDEGVSTTYYSDLDMDGFGDPLSSTQACVLPPGMSTLTGDCDDLDAAVFPGAQEICNGTDDDCDPLTLDGAQDLAVGPPCDGPDTDFCLEGFMQCLAGVVACSDTTGDNIEICDGIDNDCNGQIDEAGQSPWYPDSDGDGWGVQSGMIITCSPPSGMAPSTGDCNDADPSIFPGAPELCDGLDNDCDANTSDGSLDPLVGTLCDGPDSDLCLEGALACAFGVLECSDYTPDSLEICDGLDNDCNGLIDDVTNVVWYRDQDGDGRGNPLVATQACAPPPGYVAFGDDCDDLDAARFPGAAERCNGVDDDCDAATPDGADQAGIGEACDGPDTDFCMEGVWACQGGAFACSDSTGDTIEACDGIDNDCDGLIDEDGATPWYTDQDGDGFGTSANPVIQCAQPPGTVATAGDCNDADATINPAAAELCDGVDNDCKPGTGDGAGDPGLGVACDGGDADLCLEGVQSCVSAALWCSDGSTDNVELCNGLDDDCDGLIDEGAILQTWYEDGDGDGWGFTPVSACAAPPGTVAAGGDCDDANPSVHPGAAEGCDHLDTNCDGALAPDEVDDDSDGVDECGGDCDDSNAARLPGGLEICDGLDNDCNLLTPDGGQEAWYLAACDGGDSDLCLEGVEVCQGGQRSCTDSTPSTLETCNGVDDDCDGLVDEGLTITYFVDSDGDFFGDSNNRVEVCSFGPGLASIGGDCDDTDPTVNPFGIEVCGDGKDNDCLNGDEPCTSTPSPSPTPSLTLSPSFTLSPSITPTVTFPPTPTPTATPTSTSSATATVTLPPTPSPTATLPPSFQTPSPTSSPSQNPTDSVQPTPTPDPPGDCSCEAGQGFAGQGVWAELALGLMLLWRRRRWAL